MKSIGLDVFRYVYVEMLCYPLDRNVIPYLLRQTYMDNP